MSQTRHLQHVKSSATESTGLPKLPTATNLLYGELAVNYVDGLETLTLRNSSNKLVKFRPNTNVYVKNIADTISNTNLTSVINTVKAYSYQDYNITFLEKYSGNFDLSSFIKYVVETFYSVGNLHIMLNVAKGDDTSSEESRSTNFIVNAETMNELISSSTTPISTKSTIIGFTKYDEYFVAGDSTAMSGIEINWDSDTKAITVRFVYLESVYRINGEEI